MLVDAKAFLAVILMAAGALSQTTSTSTASTTCARRVVRKEIRDLTAAERTVYMRGMRKAVTGNPSILNRLSATHMRYNDVIHSGPNFLPWHRLFIRRLEGEIQKTEPTFALHYWDWTKDARAPERSPLLQSNMFGGNSRGGCLRTSSFGNIMASLPRRGCLTRNYANGNSPGAFYPRAITDAIRDQYSSYTDFAMALEGGPHAAPHNGLGGHVGTMYSPEDPVFFAHHSFIDYLFAQWQDRASSRLRAYGGTNQNGSRASSGDTLVGLKGRVSDVLDYRRLCYSYRATGEPDDYGSEQDMEWAGNPGAQQQQPQQQQQTQQDNGGWVWNAQANNWVWQGLVRRSYTATRPAAAAAALPAAPKPTYTAPAAAAPTNYTAGVPKVAPLRIPSDEEIECIAKKYTAPLVHPRPIDEEWLKMNGLCVVTQRALEKSYCDFIDKVNTKIVEVCDAY